MVVTANSSDDGRLFFQAKVFHSGRLTERRARPTGRYFAIAMFSWPAAGQPALRLRSPRVEHDAVNRQRAAPHERRRALATSVLVFGRHAAGVETNAAEQFPLDQCHGHPSVRQPTGQGRTGSPGSNNDRIEEHARCATTTRPARSSQDSPVTLLLTVGCRCS
jgi:hypothetical protein